MFTGHESPLTINNGLKQHHRSPGLCHRNVPVQHFRTHALFEDGAAAVLPQPTSDQGHRTARGSQQLVTHPAGGLGDATKPFLNQALPTCPCSLAQVAAGFPQQGCCRENSLSVNFWATLGALRATFPLLQLWSESQPGAKFGLNCFSH